MNQRIGEIRARCEAATPGPWKQYNDWEVITPSKIQSVAHTFNPNANNDAEFIAHVREDVPYLLSEVERLIAEIEQYRQMEQNNCAICMYKSKKPSSYPCRTCSHRCDDNFKLDNTFVNND